jgi:hypothetical protein
MRASARAGVVVVMTVAFAVLMTLAPRPVMAHPARASAVLLDIGQVAIEAEVQVPLDQLGLALSQRFEEKPGDVLPAHQRELTEYLASHARMSAPDGASFAVSVRSLEVREVDGAWHLVALLTFSPPSTGTTSSFSLHYNAVLHKVVTHKVFVQIRRDFKNAVFASSPELADVIRFQHESVQIDRSNGTWLRGMAGAFVLGVRHIAEGTDHLLFLMALLLPAPLLARRRRWEEPAGVKQSLLKVLKIVTAFTVGHSLTLALAGTGALHVPSQPVEVLVAVSILVSAVHAVRPLFPEREPVIAGAFGLVHGLAFATLLTDLGFESGSLAAGLISFNLGIEAMQVAAIVLTMPWLLLLSRSGPYVWVRTCGAAFSGLAALGWTAERALGLDNPLSPIVERLFEHSFLLIAVLAAVAAGTTAHRMKMRGVGKAAHIV